MANLLTLKRRIQTAQNVSKTTRAMQMIAASKLKKAQDAALSSRAYTESISSLASRILAKVDSENNPYVKSIASEKDLVILLSPDKGLCGGLITNLAREVYALNLQKNTKILTVGKKAESIALKLGLEILASFPFGTTLPKYDVVYPIIRIAEDSFKKGEISSVRIVNTEFVSIFSQKPTTFKLLPIEGPSEKESDLIIFEPNVEELLPGIIQRYSEMRLYQSVLESYLSEQAARMLAMQNATDNALEIIEELKLDYNKQRQEKITSEILDIGSGAIFAHE